ncbi:MAG TPA: serine hydrolase [Terriglobia bacterium]|nr:serine hydrolase [Terriglobia bacterium]
MQIKWRGLFVCFLMALDSVATVALSQENALYQGANHKEFMKKWLMLGPISIPRSKGETPDEEVQKKAFETEFLSPCGGERSVAPSLEKTCSIFGKSYSWQLFQSELDTVDLVKKWGKNDFAIAYAWAEIEVPNPSTIILGVGSDDAVKIWLNGNLVHENWVIRALKIDEDVVKLELHPGKNQILLKVFNGEGAWEFSCRALKSDQLEEKLITASATSDLDTVQRLLSYGINVNATCKLGLTAWQSATVHGQKEIANYLASKGADTQRVLPPPDTLVDKLFNQIIIGDSPGAAVLVAKQGKVLFEKGYGYSNIGDHVPITPETKFRIGSITKQFTAAAILRLKEEGKLDLNDPLSKYLPDFPRGPEVTLHHLLTHTSGIHSYTEKPDFMETVTVPVKPEALIDSIKKDPYDFAPGSRWKYNNSGYFLLGYIVEKVSGQSYAEFLKKNFFDPLEMQNTGVHCSTEVLEHEAEGYSYEGGKIKKALNWDMSRAGGAGSLYSTVDDLFRWNEALFHGKVLNPASLKQAFTPVSTTQDRKVGENRDEGYGYGWSLSKLRGLQEISHGGGLQGFLSFLLRYPGENFTVVLLANAAAPLPGLDPGGLAHEITQFYIGNRMEARQIPKPIQLSPEDLEAYVGRYDYGGAILTVNKEGNQLFAQLTGQPRFEIFPKSKTEFYWKVVEAQVTFVKNEQGEVITAIHHQGRNVIEAPKLKEESVVNLDPKLLDRYVGKYDYGQGKAILTVTREENHLFAQLTGQPKFEIYPKSETEFFWKVVAAYITFVTDERGKVTKGIHRQGGQTLEVPKIE